MLFIVFIITGSGIRYKPHVVGPDFHVQYPLAEVLVLGRQYASARVHFDQTVLDAEQVVQTLGELFLEIFVLDVHVWSRKSFSKNIMFKFFSLLKTLTAGRRGAAVARDDSVRVNRSSYHFLLLISRFL